MTGGKYYNVRRTTDLEQALTDINEVDGESPRIRGCVPVTFRGLPRPPPCFIGPPLAEVGWALF
jgi:hypothetical protein